MLAHVTSFYSMNALCKYKKLFKPFKHDFSVTKKQRSSRYFFVSSIHTVMSL